MNCKAVYKKLHQIYGEQGWWPLLLRKNLNRKSSNLRQQYGLTYGLANKNLKNLKTPFRDPYFEMAVGAILTQNTAWKNVASAINNLYDAKALTPKKIAALSNSKLERLIRPAGYFRQKTKKIKMFSEWMISASNGDIRKLIKYSVKNLRTMLLERWGIGPETADSIMLYALNKPIFVIDTYTKRLLHKMGIKSDDYSKCQNFFQSNLPASVEMFKEYHALIAASGKDKHKKII